MCCMHFKRNLCVVFRPEKKKCMSFLNALDYDVEIRIHPKVAEAARVYVSHSSVQFTA